MRPPTSRLLSAALAAGTFSIGCAAGTATAPPPAPTPSIQAPAPEAVAAAPTDIQPLEPGRFDMGKMWTFEYAPLDYFQEAYGFRPTVEWLEQARLATLRFSNCTASFVSPSGLVMSNHHCAREATDAVARDGENLLDDGFYAATADEERPVPEMWADQLVEIHDVTTLIERGIDPTAPEAARAEAREARIEQVGDSLGSARHLSCEVTPLFHGGVYSAYCYRRYDDVRLVFAPELQIGYFGGDPDNFTYPRYNLDVSFFRVYDESGRPLQPSAYFPWDTNGVAAGDAVFVIGNPGSTERLSTIAQLEFARDHREPFIVRLLKSRTDMLQHYMEHHPDQRGRYINEWFGWMNSLKAYTGRAAALKDPVVMGRKLGWELRFKDAVMSRPELARRYGSLWDEIARLQQEAAQLYPTVMGLAMGGSLRSQTLATASQMLQYAQASQRGAPAGDLAEFRTALTEREISRDLDHHMIELQIQDATELLGADDAWVTLALKGRTPEDAGRAIIAESPSVVDREQRTALLENPAAVLASSEPAFVLAREATTRRAGLAQQFGQIGGQEEALLQRLGRALYDVYGTSLPPDATFTLRIADGVVQAYDYNGTIAPLWTTYYGLYDRHYGHKEKPEWALPARWLPAPEGLDLGTPLNFVSTNDITGGNSGSPVINTGREIVGIAFDGNIESLSGDFIFTTEANRTVSVHAAGILEALDAVYHADRIVRELRATAR
jgi:hypothetical protein